MNEVFIDEVLSRRQNNIDLITGDAGRDSLDKDLIFKLDKIQKCLARFKSLHQNANQTFLKEVKSMNLNRYTIEVAENIAKTEFASNKDSTLESFHQDLSIIIEICEVMHQRYDDFQKQLVNALSKNFKYLSDIVDLEEKTHKRRSLLFMMTELFVIGIIVEYKRIFQSLQEIFTE